MNPKESSCGREYPSSSPAKHAFTLIELLIVIAVLAILLAILLPSLEFSREIAKEMTCIGNVHVLQTAVLNYETDWRSYPANSAYAVPSKWLSDEGDTSACIKNGTLYKYVGSEGPYHCINDTYHKYISYSMNGAVGLSSGCPHWYVYSYFFNQIYGHSPGDVSYWVWKTSQFKHPDTTMVFIEEGKWWDGTIMGWPLTYLSGDSSPDAPVLRHYGDFVASFADGHAAPQKVIRPRQKTGSESNEEQTEVSLWTYAHPEAFMPGDYVAP